jgi:hypothetical protein
MDAKINEALLNTTEELARLKEEGFEGSNEVTASLSGEDFVLTFSTSYGKDGKHVFKIIEAAGNTSSGQVDYISGQIELFNRGSFLPLASSSK